MLPTGNMADLRQELFGSLVGPEVVIFRAGCVFWASNTKLRIRVKFSGYTPGEFAEWAELLIVLSWNRQFTYLILLF